MLITEANASERLGAIILLHEAVKKLQKLEVVRVDQDYSDDEANALLDENNCTF